MKEILDFLSQNKYGSLATCDNGKADVRPFEVVFHCDRGVFFYTSAEKDVFKQLNANPNISFCATDQNYNYAKVSGSVSFSNDNEDKTKIIANSQFAQKMFANSNADNMKVFFLPHASCVIHYHADNREVQYQF